MNRLKLASKSFAYSWNLIFESSKFMIFLYFALMLITTSFPLLSAFLLKYVLDALTMATPEIERKQELMALISRMRNITFMKEAVCDEKACSVL